MKAHSSSMSYSSIPWGLLCILALVGLIIAAVPLVSQLHGTLQQDQELVVDVPDSWADVPLTPHAQQSHADQKYNAQTIPVLIDRVGCRRKELALCPDGSIHLMCEVYPEIYVGLVYGTESQQIVTAFRASEKYWSKDLRKCTKINSGGLAW